MKVVAELLVPFQPTMGIDMAMPDGESETFCPERCALSSASRCGPSGTVGVAFRWQPKVNIASRIRNF